MSEDAAESGPVSMDGMDPRYLNGIRLFNEGEYFACHDELEEVWTEIPGDEREFYQGLIHAAVCLFHFEGHNLTGARKMYGSAKRYLTPFAPTHMGLQVDRLLEDLQLCFQELCAATGPYPAHIQLDESLIPRLYTCAKP